MISGSFFMTWLCNVNACGLWGRMCSGNGYDSGLQGPVGGLSVGGVEGCLGGCRDFDL